MNYHSYIVSDKKYQLSSSISERLGRELADEMDARSSWVRNVLTVDPVLMCWSLGVTTFRPRDLGWTQIPGSMFPSVHTKDIYAVYTCFNAYMLLCHIILFYTLTWIENDFTSCTTLCQHSLINVIPTNCLLQQMFLVSTCMSIPFFIYEHNTSQFILINTKRRINSEGGGSLFKKKMSQKLRTIH